MLYDLSFLKKKNSVPMSFRFQEIYAGKKQESKYTDWK